MAVQSSPSQIASTDRLRVLSGFCERRGPVAQWLEPAAHNGLVGGSSPSRPTTPSMIHMQLYLFAAPPTCPALAGESTS